MPKELTMTVKATELPIVKEYMEAIAAQLLALQERNAKLEKVVEAAQDILWVFDCTCIEAYTDRGLHEPNAICGEGDGLSAALAALEADE